MTEQSLDVVQSTPTVEATFTTPQTVVIGAAEAPMIVAEQGGTTTVTQDVVHTVKVYDPTMGLTYNSNPNNPFVSGTGCNTVISGAYAITGFIAVELHWTVTNDTPHYIEVWRSSSLLFASAECVATAQGNSYVDSVEPGETYYYWLVPVAYNGTSGSLSESVSVTTGNNQAGFVEALGELTATYLSPTLSNQINNLISDAATQSELNSNSALAQQNNNNAVQFAGLLNITDQLRADTSVEHAYALAQLESKSAFFTSEFASVAAVNAALSTQLTTEITDVNTAITNEQSSRSDQYAAFASDVNAVVAEYKGLTEDVDARVSSESATRSTEYGGLATRMNTLESGFSTLEGTTAATITEKTDAITSANEAMAQQVGNLSSSLSLTNAAVGAETTNRIAEIASQNATITNLNTSLSTAIQTLTSTVGGNTASIATHSTVINGVEAENFVKVDVNGNVAGYGVYGTPTYNEFAINADVFKIADGSNRTQPFMVVTGTGLTITGDGTHHGNTTKAWQEANLPTARWFSPGTYLDTVFIADASIDVAKISNLTVDYLQAHGAVTTEELNAFTINAENINTGTINGMTIVGGRIESGDAVIQDGTISGVSIQGAVIAGSAYTAITDYSTNHFAYITGVASTVTNSTTGGGRSGATLTIKPYNYHLTALSAVMNSASNMWRYRRHNVTPSISGNIDVTKQSSGYYDEHRNKVCATVVLRVYTSSARTTQIAAASFQIKIVPHSTGTRTLTHSTGGCAFTLSYGLVAWSTSDGWSSWAHNRIGGQDITFSVSCGFGFSDANSQGLHATVEYSGVGYGLGLGSKNITITDVAENDY